MAPFFLDVWMELAAQKQASQPHKNAGEMPHFSAANDDSPAAAGQGDASAAPSQA